MSEYITPALTFITGVGTGLISGLLVQRKRSSDDQKNAKISRLFPFMEHAYPIIERLKKSSSYVFEIQDNIPDFRNVFPSVIVSLDEYDVWFNSFKEEGMIRELESVDRKLLDHLVGLSNFTKQKNLHGDDFISQHIQNFSNLCIASEELLGNWLMR